MLNEVGDVLNEVDVEIGDQSKTTVALAGTAYSCLTMTITMSLALCHLNIARVEAGLKKLRTRQAS